VFQTQPRQRGRPDLRQVLEETRIKSTPLSKARGVETCDLARTAMLTRMRDLYGIAYANPHDCWMLDNGEGLQFIALGLQPSRRFLIDTLYVFIIIKNHVPIGYLQSTGAFGSAEINFNIFPPHRGAQAAHIYGQCLGMIHQWLGIQSFSIDPYQLGEENDEALQSGAWWFYFKLGFRPASQHVRALVARERRRMKNSKRYRSSIETLSQLASDYLHFNVDASVPKVNTLNLDRVPMHGSLYLAKHYGSKREEGIDDCVLRAQKTLGIKIADEPTNGPIREAWERWAPTIICMRGVERWSKADRSAFAEIVRAKGARRELDYAHQLASHTKLRDALLRLAKTAPQ